MKSFAFFFPALTEKPKSWIRGAVLTAIPLFIILAIILTLAGCIHYNPAMFPSYDVLNPGPEVRKNPLAFTADGNLIVNFAFIQWVEELKQEILKLRRMK